MHEVEAVTDDDEGKLIWELRFLEEVLDLLRVVVVALSTDPLNFTNLASASSGLDVLEVHLGILAEVNDGAKVIVETCRKVSTLAIHSSHIC
jgi:hypothetical protein